MNVASVLDTLVRGGEAVWRASWQASVVALLVGAVLLIFGRHIAPRWRHALWMLVLVRLALPVVPSSPISVFNLAPADAAQASKTSEKPVAFAVSDVAGRSSVRTNVGMSSVGLGGRVREPTAALIPSAVAPAGDGMTRSRVIAAVWAAGVLLLALRIAWATLRVSRTMRRLERVTDESVLAALRSAGAELQVRRLPRLLTGDEAFSPALVGFVRPRLLLPRGLIDRFDRCELRLILLHELAHLKRRDVLVNWLATILAVLHWPNPVVWIVGRRVRLERELACDELVLSRTASDSDRRAYGHTIVKLLETLSPRARVLSGSVGILEGKHQMKRRIAMIARFVKHPRGWSALAALLVLALALVALTDAAVRAQDPAPATAASSEAKAGTAETKSPSDEELAKRDPKMRELLDEITRLTTERKARTASLSPLNPQIKALDNKIAAATDAKNAHADKLRAEMVKPVSIENDELVTVSVYGLMANDTETIKTARVDGEGNIALPIVGNVKAAGLRPVELEKAVAKAYGGILKNPIVVVSLPRLGESHQLGARRGRSDVQRGGGGGGGGGQGLFGGEQIDPAVAAVLEKKIPEVNFDGVALVDVVDFLREVSASNIFVDWRALEEAGIDRNAPVNVKLRDVAFKDTLSIILRGISHELYHRIEDGVIQIDVYPEERQPELVMRAYDVSNLIAADNAKAGASDLAKVISETVEPDSWRSSGGPHTIGAFGTKVVITAKSEIHRRVADLLAILAENPTAARPADVLDGTLDQAPPEAGTVRGAKLWKEKYAPRVIKIGDQSNYADVVQQFLAELNGSEKKVDEDKP